LNVASELPKLDENIRQAIEEAEIPQEEPEKEIYKVIDVSFIIKTRRDYIDVLDFVASHQPNFVRRLVFGEYEKG